MYKVIQFLFFSLLLSVFSRGQQARFFTSTSEQDSILYQCFHAKNFYFPFVHSDEKIIHHLGYSLVYDETNEQAKWVAYDLSKSKLTKVANRSNQFLVDPQIETGSANDNDYKKSGFDRGHLAPAADMSWSEQAMKESFYYSNMSPQRPQFNRGIWKKLETLVRHWAALEDTIFIITGPVLQPGLPTIGPNQVAVPELYYKVVLNPHHEKWNAIGLVLPNDNSKLELKNFVVSVDSVERLTGLDFFESLPDSIEKRLEHNVCFPCWQWESISTLTISETTPEKHFSSQQCNANTQKGTRCKRKTRSLNGFCSLHGGK